MGWMILNAAMNLNGLLQTHMGSFSISKEWQERAFFQNDEVKMNVQPQLNIPSEKSTAG